MKFTKIVAGQKQKKMEFSKKVVLYWRLNINCRSIKNLIKAWKCSI